MLDTSQLPKKKGRRVSDFAARNDEDPKSLDSKHAEGWGIWGERVQRQATHMIPTVPLMAPPKKRQNAAQKKVVAKP